MTLTCVAVLAIIALTLTPDFASNKVPPSSCIICGALGGLDFILNVLLFVPLGIGLGLLGVKSRRGIALALAFSVTIELLQLRIPGRDTNLGDVVTNAAGALLGLLILARWRALVLPERAMARTLASFATAAWWSILAVSGWGVRTSLPATTYWGQWEPELLQFDRFPGRLLGATVAGYAFPDGVMGNSPEFRRRLLGDSALIQARVLAGGATKRIAPIVSVFDMYRTEVFLLGQRGTSALFSLRMHAADLRMREPAVRIDGVFPTLVPEEKPEGELRLTAGVSADRTLWIESLGKRSTRRSIALDVALGWSFLLPFSYAYGAEAPWLTAAWLAALAVPIAFWSRRDGRRASLALGVLALSALAIVPPLVGAHATAWWEWAAVLGGLGAGTWLGWWSLERGAGPASGERLSDRTRERRPIATL